jgi:arylsulfatase A-like enzyme
VRERGFWHRQFGRFLWPDRDREVRRWHTVDATVFLEPDMPIEIKCLNAPLGCVIGDVKALVREQAAPRSVLMILVDTMRFDAADRGHAPRLAALGESGTTFRRAISPGNMTSPSTNALLACRTASDLGRMAFAYAVNKNHRERHYENGPESFPAAFRRAGFTTAMIGNVSVLSEIFGVGVNHGFQQQIAIESDAYDTPLIARATIDWLKAHGSEPFFLYVHLHGPHAAYRAPWRDIRATKPATGAFASYPNILRWLYQSEIHYTDRYLGQILDAVQRLGLSETTNIALTSDHGDMHTQHEFSGNEAGPSFSGSYFDHGATLLNDEIRVPLMFSGPGVRAGQVVDGVTSTLAVGPTLLSLVGLEPISACGARSLAAELDGSPPPSPPPVVGSEAFQGRAVIMDGRYKYIRMYTPVDKRVYREGAFDSPHRMFLRRHQLYDLDTDPHETRDLSASDPDLLERAEVTYKQYFSIRTMFELVIDAPDRPAIAVHVPWPWRAKRSLGAATVAVTDEDRMVTTSGEARVILELSTDAATDVARAVPLPTVVVGGQSLPIRMTSMRLPLDVALDDLPIESGGAGSLLPPVGAGAILRRVDDDGQRERRINVGNPAFDKVLREWGYLND